ncbi:hypothetical protein F2Q69_00024257 [Brassica cretica]|uniref:Uncharacterized protein n=1 Tax=Brassica cretica TaxID=69181 RepID=A0A8S9QCR5_BRACR|nr:hypothetical protein F2Q69_00024257 [Brassica cretica]
MRVFNSTLERSFREARLLHFKAEEIERKFVHFQNEVAERERRQAESHSRALIRAERKGRWMIAAELARRATLFDAKFRSFKDAQAYVGDFRECRSSVGQVDGSSNRGEDPRALRTHRGFGGHDGSGSRCCRRRRRSRSACGLVWSLDVWAECGRLLFERAMALQGHLTMNYFSSKDCLDGMPLSWAFLRPTLDYCDLLQVNRKVGRR